MPTNLRDVCEMLNNRDIDHKLDVEHGIIITNLPTKKYTHADCVHAIQIVIKIEENGEFFRCIAPYAYTGKQAQHNMAIFQTCMHITRDDQLIQCCFDESTGEICIQDQIFLGESSLSERQLIKLLFRIVRVVDTYDESFRSAMDTGTCVYMKINSDRIKLAQLAKKLFDVSSENLDQVLKQLDCVKAPTLAENKKQSVFH